jgi:cyanophycinase-like exopeptidase
VTRQLAIMGSGETAPTMIKPHRQIFDSLGEPPVPAVLLDTPYGFQANADDITAKAIEYFRSSVGRDVHVAGLRRREGAAPARWEESMSRLASARWVFAGPGSPTYALRQWRNTDVSKLLSDKLSVEGCVVFASAAALTLGRWTVPVYEIYKVGADPVWEEGLDLLSFLGPEVAVIPHYDNAEGGNHDTRFCYLGEWRLAALEAQMGEDGWVLGVDEHTGCVFDLDTATASVVGNGSVTVRRSGRSTVLRSGATLPIADLVGLATASGEVVTSAPLVESSPEPGRPTNIARTALHAEIQRLEGTFESAVSNRDVPGAVNAILDLEDTLVAWSGDTTQSDAGERGRAALRRMVARLGELAREGARDPRDVVGGFVDSLLAERATARSTRRYDDADRIRDALIGLGVEVRDSKDGTEWELA